METLHFIFTGKCGDRFIGEMEHRGHWKPQTNRLVYIKRKKTCADCAKKEVWKQQGRRVHKTEQLFCQALGVLVERNGKDISYPLCKDM